MIKRHRTAVLAAFAVVASVFLLPASPASAATFDNACVNSLIPTQSSLIPITMTATTSPNPVAPGGTVTLSNIQQHRGHPPGGLRGRLQPGVLVGGAEQHPVTDVHTKIEGTNTVEGIQDTNSQTGTAADDDRRSRRVPGTGDETATAGSFDVTYANQTWTAGASGHDQFPRGHGADSPAGSAGVTTTGGINITAVDRRHPRRAGSAATPARWSQTPAGHDHARRSGSDVRQHDDRGGEHRADGECGSGPDGGVGGDGEPERDRLVRSDGRHADLCVDADGRGGCDAERGQHGDAVVHGADGPGDADVPAAGVRPRRRACGTDTVVVTVQAPPRSTRRRRRTPGRIRRSRRGRR